MKLARLIFAAFVVFCIGYALKGQSHSASISSEDFWGPTSGTVTITAVEYDVPGNRVRYNLTSKPWSGASGWSGAWGALYDIRAGIRSADGTVDVTLTTVGNSGWLPANKNPYTLSVQGYWSMAGWIGNVGGKTTFSVTPNPTENKVLISLRNTSDTPRTYVVKQGSTTLGSVTLQPGEALLQQFTAPTSAPVEVFVEVHGAEYDGDVWVKEEGAVTQVSAGTVTPKSVPLGTNPAPSTADVVIDPALAPSKTNYDSQAKKDAIVLWKPRAANNDPGDQKDLLTNPVYREGVEAIREGIADAEDTRKKENEEAKAAAAEKTAAAQAQGATAGSAAAALIGNAPTAKGYSVSAGSLPSLTVSMPARFGGGTFDFNPFREDRFGPIATWFRTATEWAVLVALGVLIWRQLGEYLRGFSTMRQAQGNTIAAGTGAQATSLVAAIGITTAVVVALTALMAWGFESLNIATLVGQITTNPLATMPAAVFAMVDKLFPVATIITAAVARMAFSIYGNALFATCAAVVRFIVP